MSAFPVKDERQIYKALLRQGKPHAHAHKHGIER